MSEGRERRTEERLRHKWPVLFSEDVTRRIDQGLMVDVSSGGIAFTCTTETDYPRPGQELTVQFSLPRFDEAEPSAQVGITRTGRVCRVDDTEGAAHLVAIQFDKPLTLKPYEQANIELMRSRNPES
jgi:hypothetical protein